MGNDITDVLEDIEKEHYTLVENEILFESMENLYRET